MKSLKQKIKTNITMTHKLLILMTTLVLAGCAGKTRTNNTQAVEPSATESFDVRELIESLREKLKIRQSIEEIATDWNGGEPVFPHSSSHATANADSIACIKSLIDNCSKRSDTELYYPWRDVLASMYAYPDCVVFSYRRCPCCGGKVVGLNFVSCRSSWQHLCGRAGSMVICPSCVKQIAVRITVLN